MRQQGLDGADILALMSALYSDTDPEVEALQIKMWRQASPTRKMHMLAQLNVSARILARKVYGEMNCAE